MHRLLSLFVLCEFLLCSSSPAPAETVYPHAVVAADHPLASAAGVEILKQGGNVVDATVATSFALSVVRPYSCGIGGGGFMVIWDAEKQESVALDYRERAPHRAGKSLYQDDSLTEEERASLSRTGAKAVAVPGTVAGLIHAQKQYGKLPLKSVMAPAIRLARDGIPVDPHTRQIQKTVLKSLSAIPEGKTQFAPLVKQYLNNAQPWTADAMFHSPQLQVLERIAEHGASGFYEGPVADALVRVVQQGGGILTHRDLRETKPIVRKTLQGRIGEDLLLTMPPPSSGGVAMLEMLNILTAFESQHPQFRLEKLGQNSPEFLHLLGEIMKHAFADRAEFLGDTDFAKVPVPRLISPEYGKRLAQGIDMQQTRPLKSYGKYWTADDAGTSHISVIDAQGNAVACTETINTLYGSFLVEPTYGIVLNNEMDDFAAQPGKPNAFGLIQSEANAVHPGKKPLSSMSPTIVVRDGKAILAVGASGGPRIITGTFQVLLNLHRFGMTPKEAVTHPRFHHQWLPHQFTIEPELSERTKLALERKGHIMTIRKGLSVTQAVMRTTQGVSGASDPRKHGQPAGY